MEKKHQLMGTEKITKLLIQFSLPAIIGMLVNALYNIVDRIYIGNIEKVGHIAIAGVGIVFPIVIFVFGFSILIGLGSATNASLNLGRKKKEEAERFLGTAIFFGFIVSLVLMVLVLWKLEWLVSILGGSDKTGIYAAQYLKILAFGFPAAVVGYVANASIRSDGNPKMAMATLLIGAITNIVLDPIFIFYFNLGISGAAIATIISQLLSVIWVMKFLLGDKTILKLNKKRMKLESELSKNIMGLGLAGFVMSATNGAVQIACNATLKGHGGDVYIGIMTVLSSIRDVIMLPIHGVTTGAQPVLGYNYGAKKYDRIKKGIFFITIVTVIYMLITWIVVFIFPENFIKVFSSDNELLVKGIPAMNIYYFGFFMMAFQVAGQSIFVALGQSKQAVFFSLFRKIIVVVPLTLFLPYVANLGVKGVFLAEPISNFVGGTACYIAMLMTIRKILKDEREKI